MLAAADFEAETVLSSLLALELYVYRRAEEVEAIMSPLHPLYLWRSATIVRDVPSDSALAREEIFGPILPMRTFSTVDEATRLIRRGEKPLTLYLFTRDGKVIEQVLRDTHAGTTAVNHTLVHFYSTELPFGGSGASGFGKGHGSHGFQAFSNARGVLRQRFPVSTIDFLFPPYGRFKQKLVDLTLKYF